MRNVWNCTRLATRKLIKKIDNVITKTLAQFLSKNKKIPEITSDISAIIINNKNGSCI
jgi:hypothetical protein